MTEHQQAHIIGLGSYVPKRILSNADLEKMVDTSDEWIVSRSGIRERHIAQDDEAASDMGVSAANRALSSAEIDAASVDLILCATMTPDFLCPSTASVIQSVIGASSAAAVDMGAACSGFVYALATAKAFVESGLYSTVLVVATEKMSSVMDYTDRTTCVLFGDGAAACVVSNKKAGFVIGSTVLGSDGCKGEIMTIPAGGSRTPATAETVEKKQHFFQMQGREVFKAAVRTMERAVNDCLEKSGLDVDAVSWLIPHQANTRIIDAVTKRSSMAADRVYNEVWRYGNTSAASVGLALLDLLRDQELAVGERVMLVAFGAGLTWGSVLLTKASELKTGVAH